MKWLIAAGVGIVFATTAHSADPGSSMRLVASAPVLATAPPRYVTAPGQQNLLGVIATRSGFLVAWNEYLGWPTFALQQLRVTRVRKDGSVVDPVGIQVTTSAAFSVALLSEGDATRLYWTGPEGAGLKILTTTVDDQGSVGVIERVDVLIPLSDRQPIDAERTAAGDFLRIGRYLLRVNRAHCEATIDLGGWGEPSTLTASNGGLVATWVTTDGTLMFQRLSSTGVIEGSHGGTGIAAEVIGAGAAGDGGTVLIVYSTAEATRLARLDSGTGALTDAGRFPVPYMRPLVVWNGSKFIVAWNENDGTGILGNDVPASGSAAFAPRSLVPRGEAAYIAVGSDSMLIADRRGYCFRFSCEHDVWVSSLTLEASLPAESEVLVSGVAVSQYYQEAAAIGDRFFAVWQEQGGLFAVPLNRGAPSEPVAVSLGFSVETAALATDGTRALVVAIGTENGANRILKRVILDHDGKPVGQVSGTPIAEQESGLAAASAGALFLAAWRRVGGVVAVRIDTNGNVLDDPPLELGPATIYSPTIAASFDGKAFVVAWADLEGVNPPYAGLIRVVRVDPSGIIASTDVPVRSPTRIVDPSVACGAQACLMAWTQSNPDLSAASDVDGIFLESGASGNRSAPFPIAESDKGEYGSSVAWDGRSFFVAWTAQESEGPSADGVRATTLELENDVVKMRDPISLGRAQSGSASSLACGARSGCVELHPAPTDDSIHGISSRLVKSFLRVTRLRGIRR